MLNIITEFIPNNTFRKFSQKNYIASRFFMIKNIHDNMATIFFCETKHSTQYIMGMGVWCPLFDTPFLKYWNIPQSITTLKLAAPHTANTALNIIC